MSRTHVKKTAPPIINHRAGGLASLVLAYMYIIIMYFWFVQQFFQEQCNRTTIGVSDESDHLIVVQTDDSTNYCPFVNVNVK